MAVVELFGEDAPPAGVPVRWRDDIDAEIRPVPASVDDRLGREYTRGLKVQQISQQSAEAARQRAVEHTRKRAAYALVDTKNFVLSSKSPAIVDQLSEALGEKVELCQSVVLDGRWTDKVKALVFQLLPKFSAWVSDQADKLAKAEAVAEEELGEA